MSFSGRPVRRLRGTGALVPRSSDRRRPRRRSARALLEQLVPRGCASGADRDPLSQAQAFPQPARGVQRVTAPKSRGCERGPDGLSLGVIALALASLLAASSSHAAGTFTNTYSETWTPSETLTHTQSNTETRTPTFTASATPTRTFTRTVTATFVIRIVVQTMAGEQVRSFSRGMPPEPVIPNEIRLVPNPFSPDCDAKDEWVTAVGFTTGAQQVWDGKNDRGDPAENGRYWVTVSLFDTVGVLRGQYVRDVLLLAKGNVIRVTIYDLAGRVRKEFAKICLPVKMTDFELDPNPFTPGVDSAGAWKYLRIKINGTVVGLPQWPPPPTPNNNFQLLGGLSNIIWPGDGTDGKL